MADFAKLRAMAVRRGGPAHLRVYHRGEVVVDERYEVGERAIFWPFSVSKVFTATLVWALHQDGVLNVDDPVAEYWPEFAAHGKDAITIRHVLQHRSGLPRVGSMISEVQAMSDWPTAITRIAAAKPRPDAIEAPTYEWLAWGFILGEAAQRAAGQSFPEVLRERILAPGGLDDTFAGVPFTERWRSVPFRSQRTGTPIIPAVLNRDSVREAVIPAGGISTSAHDIGELLETLRLGGERVGLDAHTVEAMVAPSNGGEFDRFAGSKVWWGNGVQLGHPARNTFNAAAFGMVPSERAFGHNGSNFSMAWTDPDRELTFVYLTGIDENPLVNRLRMMAFGDAAASAVD